MNRRAMARHILRSLIAAFALSLSACGDGGAAAERPPLEGANIGGPFTLTNKDGQTVRWSDFAGRWRIVYFGYTFCPDVCPLDVQHIMQGYRLFAKDHAVLAQKIVPMFITIDPARDTPAVVGQFAANFGPELIGLTGTQEQVTQATKAFAVFAQKREGATPDSYLMDHSRAAYLMGPEGQAIALLPADQDGHTVATEIAKWVK
jgi:protein SCO1/2